VLPEELNEEILRYKKLMEEKYKCKVGLKSPAHITIIPPFWADGSKEPELLRDVDTVSKHYPSFIIQTHHFSRFGVRTIFIDVTPNILLQELKMRVSGFFQDQSTFHLKAEQRPFHPHITIATRDLFKKDFHDAWPLFRDREYRREWKVEGLSVLRHNKKNWEVIHTSQFE
jgi:2'-5' RNA ligase